MTSSGTYSFAPSLSDLTIEVFERLQIAVASAKVEQLLSMQRSFNLVFSRWANRGVNLWKVDEVTVPLLQGVGAYAVDAATISMLPSPFIRVYSLGSPTSLTPAFDATSGSTTIGVTQADHGLSVNDWLQIVVPVAIGGIVLSGYYQCASVTSTSAYTITAATAATGTASGGTVPAFATTAGSTTVTVTLANHGYVAGDSFTVQVSTDVGGLTLSGAYTVASVTDANTFTFTAAYAAGLTDTASENAGDTQIATQSTTATPTDRVLFPLSRQDFAAIPNKTQQGVPTSYWFDRLISPTFNVWPLADANGPYEFRYYRLRQVEDAALASGQTPDIPYRFLEALASGVAAHMAMKWKPEAYQALNQIAAEAWLEAAEEDREKVPTYIQPQLSRYFQ